MIEGTSFPMAPDMQVSQWFNTPKPISLTDHIGKVVSLEAFQMLCPGCVSHGLPQAQQIHNSKLYTITQRHLTPPYESAHYRR